MFLLTDNCPGDNKNSYMFNKLTLFAEKFKVQGQFEFFQNQPAHGKDEYDAEGGITKATIREIFRDSRKEIKNLNLDDSVIFWKINVEFQHAAVKCSKSDFFLIFLR